MNRSSLLSAPRSFLRAQTAFVSVLEAFANQPKIGPDRINPLIDMIMAMSPRAFELAARDFLDHLQFLLGLLAAKQDEPILEQYEEFGPAERASFILLIECLGRWPGFDEPEQAEVSGLVMTLGRLDLHSLDQIITFFLMDNRLATKIRHLSTVRITFIDESLAPIST